MIYFDNASTTPVSPEAVSAVTRMLTRTFGNPSSVHIMGLAAEREIKQAAETISIILGVRPDEIVFTSGGTESNNLAVIGAAMAKKGKAAILSQARSNTLPLKMPCRLWRRTVLR